MKQLDEVIEKIEKMWVCPSSDEAAEYCDFMEVKEDTLHYLKEYQELTAELVELNEPLSWQELQRMECKPVYVVYHTMRTKGWALVEYADDDRIDFTTPSAMRLTVFERQMGKTWQAYRKERK